MVIDSVYGDERPSIQNYKHKLRITTIEVFDNLPSVGGLQSIEDLKIEHIEVQQYSDEIEVHDESQLDEKKKEFYTVMFAHDTKLECDVSLPTFKYIDEISAWVIIRYGYKEVYESLSMKNNKIMFLDFSLYNN